MITALKFIFFLWKLHPTDALHTVKWIQKIRPFINMGKLFLHPKKFFQPQKKSSQDSIEKTLNGFGPLYVKFGQFFSMRPDIVGIKVAHQLSKLQDQGPPFSFTLVQKTFQQDFHASLQSVFTSFNETPIAAGSIAQVHCARYGDHDVAVKIIRPYIAEAFQKNIRTLKRLIWILNAFSKKIRYLELHHVIREMQYWIEKEIDFRIEAAAMSEFQEQMKNLSYIQVPSVYWSLSSQHILTMDYMETHLISLNTLYSYHLDPQIIGKNILYSFLYQVFEKKIFHADLHTGNIFISSNGSLNILDFGITGQLSMKTKYFLCQSFLGFLKQDYTMVTKAHQDYGIINDDPKTLELFYFYVSYIGRKIGQNPLSKISVSNILEDIFMVIQNFRLPIFPELLLFQKSIFLCESVLLKLKVEDITFYEMYRFLRRWSLKKSVLTYALEQHMKKTFNNILKQL